MVSSRVSDFTSPRDERGVALVELAFGIIIFIIFAFAIADYTFGLRQAQFMADAVRAAARTGAARTTLTDGNNCNDAVNTANSVLNDILNNQSVYLTRSAESNTSRRDPANYTFGCRRITETAGISSPPPNNKVELIQCWAQRGLSPFSILYWVPAFPPVRTQIAFAVERNCI